MLVPGRSIEFFTLFFSIPQAEFNNIMLIKTLIIKLFHDLKVGTFNYFCILKIS